jgi:hypothetical protein
MEGPSPTIIDTTAHSGAPVINDSTIALVNQWEYQHDSALYHGSGFWFREVLYYFRQRDSFGITRHQAEAKPERLASETLLLTLLLFEVFLVSFLLKRGLKLFTQYAKFDFGSGDRQKSTSDVLQGSNFNVFFWLLTLVVFSLMGHTLLNARLGQQGFGLDSTILLRLFLYTVAFFQLQLLLFRALGAIFFTQNQYSRWIYNHKSVLFFYAMLLSPVLIGAEIGAITNVDFIFYWSLIFLVLARIWLFSKTIRIFSFGIGYFFYLILYLCALEILPILLYYKGLFLL